MADEQTTFFNVQLTEMNWLFKQMHDFGKPKNINTVKISVMAM